MLHVLIHLHPHIGVRTKPCDTKHYRFTSSRPDVVRPEVVRPEKVRPEVVRPRVLYDIVNMALGSNAERKRSSAATIC